MATDVKVIDLSRLERYHDNLLKKIGNTYVPLEGLDTRITNLGYLKTSALDNEISKLKYLKTTALDTENKKLSYVKAVNAIINNGSNTIYDGTTEDNEQRLINCIINGSGNSLVADNDRDTMNVLISGIGNNIRSQHSTAIGEYNDTGHRRCHMFGRYLRGRATDTVLLGQYNIEYQGDEAKARLVVIGNGTSNNNRSNAFEAGKDFIALLGTQFEQAHLTNLKSLSGATIGATEEQINALFA